MYSKVYKICVDCTNGAMCPLETTNLESRSLEKAAEYKSCKFLSHWNVLWINVCPDASRDQSLFWSSHICTCMFKQNFQRHGVSLSNFPEFGYSNYSVVSLACFLKNVFPCRDIKYRQRDIKLTTCCHRTCTDGHQLEQRQLKECIWSWDSFLWL